MRNCNPCKPEYRPGNECSIYSSQIIYDGQSFPEADIRNGDSMNNVIESLVRKLVAVSGATASIQRDSFKGVQAVRLRYEPLNVLSVPIVVLSSLMTDMSFLAGPLSLRRNIAWVMSSLMLISYILH